MRTSYTKALQLSVSILFCLGSMTGSVAATNPYGSISDRNVFGLQPPPPDQPAAPPAEPEEPPADVKVIGITTIDGIARALVKLHTKADPKTKTPAEEKGYVMIAGEPPIDGVQVVEIKDARDPDDVKVKVSQNGRQFWLGLEKDTPKTPPPQAAQGQAAATAAAARAAAAKKLAAQRAAAQGNAAVANPLTENNSPGLPVRSIRTRTPAASATQTYQPGGVPQAGQAQGYQVNFSRNRVTRDYGITGAEQEFLIEANREVSFEDELMGNVPPLPPTDSTPQDYYDAIGKE